MNKLLPILIILLLPLPAFSAELNGNTLSIIWGIPFVGVLLSIALWPLFLPKIWHYHYGKIIFFWSLCFLIPFSINFGIDPAIHAIAHAVIEEYISFILLLLVLFTVSGGILVKGNLHGTPKFNVILLGIGTILASLMGTTGAAMLMIRPIIRANDHRKHQVHVIIFFIFLVANIGGGLTPLGDPPLFIGFLKGVDFFWTVKHMLPPVLLNTVLLLGVFYLLDNHYYKKADEHLGKDPTPNKKIKIYGKHNLLLLISIVACVLMSGIWQSDVSFSIYGVSMTLPNLVRDLLFVAITLISLISTPRQIRMANSFNWEPIIEIAKLFLGIFITITPVIVILKAGYNGALSSIIGLISNQNGEPINFMYFWLSGLLSAFLDNAPTYLVFFNLASGDANILMTTLEKTLLAISMGSVFMGAVTYIGNAPNFMVKSIAEQSKIKMPGFFGYMKWSVLFLFPIFIIDSIIFFI